MIQANFLAVQENISLICRRLRRDAREVTLIGVTKYAQVEDIKQAIDAGLLNVGENKVQEGQNKFPLLDEGALKVTKHLIGHLQTNKVKQALQYFDLLQSVDSLKLAEEIQKQAAKLNRSVDILVQVNTAREEQKFGADPSAAISLIESISKLNHIRVLGLMTMAPFIDDKKIVRQCFRDLRILRDQVAEKFTLQPEGHGLQSVDECLRAGFRPWGSTASGNVRMKYLSMGMTDDYEIALEEGSNMVRVGRAIFK